MKKMKVFLMLLMIILNTLNTAGCWNYREVDKLAIVAGVAVDKNEDGQYKMTVEIVKISGGKDAKTTSELISMEGKTLFDAVRNIISVSGKRLYWSHVKIIIVSKKVASEGLIKVLDWYNRDSETRPDVHLLISKSNTAEEILKGQEETEEIKSYVIDDILGNEISLSKAPIVDILQFDINLEAQGISAVAPAIALEQINGKIVPQLMGTAIFKKSKLVGFLNGDETKDLIFIKNEVKGGVLIEKSQEKATPVTLEIFKSKTTIKPVAVDKDIAINLIIDTTVAIDEIQGTENLIDEDGRRKLELSVQNRLKNEIDALIKKMQDEYEDDIFGFGEKLRENKVQTWNRVANNWEDTFKNLKVNLMVNVHIRNSAIMSKPLEEGE